MASKQTYGDWLEDQNDISYQRVKVNGHAYAVVSDGQYTWACPWGEWQKATRAAVTSADAGEAYGDLCTLAGSVTDAQRRELAGAGYTLTA